MIDIHTHLIPGLDDGSKEEAISLDQLKRMATGGLRQVYLTTHYFKGHYEYSRQTYDDLLHKLRDEVAKQKIKIDLQPGFEVFIQPDIVEDIKRESLVMGNSQYVLCESELNGLPPDFYFNMYPLLRNGYKPILAHAERYVSIMKKPSEARDLIEKNIYIQVNAGSLLGHYGDKVQATAKTLVKEGWVHFVGSDDHGRFPYEHFISAYDWIWQHIDQHTAEMLMKDYPSRIESGELIPYQYVEVVRRTHHRKRRSWWKRIFS